jgi:nitrogen regulatory protein PII
MIKVEAIVIPDRVEMVIDAVEAEAAHLGATVVEAVGYGHRRDVPEAFLTFIVPESKVEKVVEAICGAARSGRASGDGLVWMSSIYNVRHNRTGKPLHEHVDTEYLKAGI